jgi:uncharacterized protein YbbC (DUF1343 family)
MPHVKTGLDVLVAQKFAPLVGLRVGLVTHPAAVDSQLRHAIELFAQSGRFKLAAIFGPEHGLLGQAQDLISVSSAESKRHADLHVYSLYGANEASLHPTAEQLKGLDVLVIDLQDIGSRYYTFQATMRFCLQAALPLGIKVIVLDRPNPLGGQQVEGPALQKGYESFVGCHNLAIRHGLTMGEMAILYQQELDLEDGALEIIHCEGWKREQYWDATGLPWVLPSPNMPTLDTAIVYPGQCLIEGTSAKDAAPPSHLKFAERLGSMPRNWPNGSRLKSTQESRSAPCGSAQRSRSMRGSTAAGCNCISQIVTLINPCAAVWPCWRPCEISLGINLNGAQRFTSS